MDEEEVEFGPVGAPPADDPSVTSEPVTSGVSTLNSTPSHDAQRSHHLLGAQLGRLKQETNRYTHTHTHRVASTHMDTHIP